MANELPEVTPGDQTSEFKVTKLAMYLTIAASVFGGLEVVLGSLKDAFPQWGWVGGAIALVGMGLTVLKAVGYRNSRTAIKVAAQDAAAQVAFAKAPDDAATALAEAGK